MHKRIIYLSTLLAIFGLGIISVAVAADAKSTISAITFANGNLVVKADKKISMEISRQSNPNRIVIDVKNTVLSSKLLQGKGQYVQDYSGGEVKAIRASSNFGLSPSTRIVLDLQNDAAFSITKNNANEVAVLLTPVSDGGRTKSVDAVSSSPPQLAKEPVAQPVAKGNQESVAADTVPLKDGGQVAEISPKAEASVQSQTISPAPAASPASTAAVQENQATKAAAEKASNIEKPVVAQKTTQGIAKEINFQEKYSEDNPTFVTINLKDADVRDVLQVFAQKAKLNLLLDPSVSGAITINLKEVPLNEAMNLVLKLNNLEARRVGNTLIVASKSVFAEKNLDVQVAKNYRLNNAKADDAVKIIKDALGPDSKVKIVSDNRTSSLIVTGTQADLDKVDSLVKSLDTKAQQVLIEVKLIDIRAEDSQALGFKYGMQQNQGSGYFNAPTAGIPPGTLNPNTSHITFNSLATFTQAFSAELDALVKANKAKILANPRVATQDARQAQVNITEGVVTGESVTTVAGAGSTSQLTISQVGIKLDITPKIDHEGYITMDLKPTLTVRGDQIGKTQTGVPMFSVVERSATTTLRVRNGETIVIGGLTREEKAKEEVKIPLLGDLPLLGGLFKSESDIIRNTDVILLVTPYLVGDTTDDSVKEAMEKAKKPL